MKILFYFLISLILSACTSNKITYWCGDHPCINKKEKEAYFKKTMIVEAKENFTLDKKDSKIEQILAQAKIDEKKRIKDEKMSRKNIKLEEKRKKQEEKLLAKKYKNDEKKRKQEEKLLAKKYENNKKINENVITFNKVTDPTNLRMGSFDQIVSNIISKSNISSYPDINNVD